MTLRIIPLGGLGEIGMNLMIYEAGDEVIIVDCGMMFPDAATLGVDVIIPDMTYIFDNAARFKAVFLTHGHEDHIGAVPFLVERLRLPVYGMPLALGFVQDKLDEFGIEGIDLHPIKPREVVQAGSFKVEAIRDGEVAQTRLQESAPRVIVLDMHLPHVDGSILLKQIHANPALSNTKIILATADNVRAEQYRDKSTIVLVKPISFSQLRDLSARLKL